MPVSIIDCLLKSREPSVRYKIRVNVLGEDPASREIQALREEIRKSTRVRALLKGRDGKGRMAKPPDAYRKFWGAHWVLAGLADIGYPPGDEELHPLRDQVYETWLEPQYFKTLSVVGPPWPKKRVYGDGVPSIAGRYRRCASQQGNALWATVKLGIADNRARELARLLQRWQWPDGGWNCDQDPEAKNSSFYETLTPLRGLGLCARVFGDRDCLSAAIRASEVFLCRKLYKRRSDGQIMDKEFVKLHYPVYWHYDVLAGLKVLAECGFTEDPRANDALDLLESKRLPDGGFRAGGAFYKAGKPPALSGSERVDWGDGKKGQANEWVACDALYVLKAFGRMK